MDKEWHLDYVFQILREEYHMYKPVPALHSVRSLSLFVAAYAEPSKGKDIESMLTFEPLWAEGQILSIDVLGIAWL